MLETGVDERIAEIERSVTQEERIDPSFADLRGPALGLKPIVWVGILLSVFQQAVGINVIFYYSSALWQQVGFSESDALTITVITSVTNIVVTLVAIATIDKVGRRALLLVGSAGMVAEPRHAGRRLRHRAGRADGEPALGDTAGTGRAGRRQPVRRLLRRQLGPGRLGAARRDVQQPHPRGARSAWPPPPSGSATSLISQTFPTLADIGLGPDLRPLHDLRRRCRSCSCATYVKETKGRQLEDME